jgi:hypothetical protein
MIAEEIEWILEKFGDRFSRRAGASIMKLVVHLHRENALFVP